MTPRAELSLAADGLPMELPLLQVRTGPRCVGAAAEERPRVGLCQCLGTNPESPELCWLLHSPAELLATSHRAERPFPGHVGKESVGAK